MFIFKYQSHLIIYEIHMIRIRLKMFLCIYILKILLLFDFIYSIYVRYGGRSSRRNIYGSFIIDTSL